MPTVIVPAVRFKLLQGKPVLSDRNVLPDRTVAEFRKTAVAVAQAPWTLKDVTAMPAEPGHCRLKFHIFLKRKAARTW